MDVLSPFISVLCHSDWLFHGESVQVLMLSIVVFLACVHLTLFLALSLSLGNSFVSSSCDHSMLASWLWQCLWCVACMVLLLCLQFVCLFLVHRGVSVVSSQLLFLFTSVPGACLGALHALCNLLQASISPPRQGIFIVLSSCSLFTIKIARAAAVGASTSIVTVDVVLVLHDWPKVAEWQVHCSCVVSDRFLSVAVLCLIGSCYTGRVAWAAEFDRRHSSAGTSWCWICLYSASLWARVLLCCNKDWGHFVSLQLLAALSPWALLKTT